jgi:hypothetical protein
MFLEEWASQDTVVCTRFGNGFPGADGSEVGEKAQL